MSLLTAVGEVVSFLEEQRISYVVIGDIAVQYWGEPRATREIEVIILFPQERKEAFLKAALERFRPRLPNALAFAREYRVLLLATGEGIAVDLAPGIPGYEEEVIRRAVTVQFPQARPVRLISAEDLIVHKCVAGRARNVEDVERILIRQRLNVDLDYIREWLDAISPFMGRHDPRKLFEETTAKAKSRLEQAGEAF